MVLSHVDKELDKGLFIDLPLEFKSLQVAKLAHIEDHVVDYVERKNSIVVVVEKYEFLYGFGQRPPGELGILHEGVSANELLGHGEDWDARLAINDGRLLDDDLLHLDLVLDPKLDERVYHVELQTVLQYDVLRILLLEVALL